MKRLTALVLALLGLALPAAAQEVTEISTLLTLPDQFDQQVVTIRGEIVGDYGDRGSVVWVQVNDDPYVDQPFAESGRLGGTNTGMSVRISHPIPVEFGPPGGYGIRGPIVEVTGVFRDLDPALGGLTFVEAANVELVEASRRLPESGFDSAAVVVGGTLTLLGLLTMAQRRDLLRKPNRS
ncbi:MAG TPA: hypothetical protein VMS74_01625 [Acidimicrobiia bacterium]|nr:hypothetical protein [Acidimicrobiia bacterium]